MANKKHEKQYFKTELGRFHLTRKDILALEDIIKKHMEVMNSERKKKHGDRPGAKYYDLYIQAGRQRHDGIHLGKLVLTGLPIGYYPYTEDSVSLLPKYLKTLRYLKIEGHPGITLTFTPRHTVLGAQLNYATGEEKRSMNQCIRRIDLYLSTRQTKKWKLNHIILAQ